RVGPAAARGVSKGRSAVRRRRVSVARREQRGRSARCRGRPGQGAGFIGDSPPSRAPAGGRAMNHFNYEGDELYCEGVSLRRIAEEVGTPAYVYSSATLTRHYQVFDEALAGIDHLIC